MTADRKAYKREYYLKNKERYKEWRKRWYTENKDKAIQLSKEWHKENKERSDVAKKAWREANPEKCYSYRLKTKYGITRDDFDNLFQSQGSKCAICGTIEEPPNGWHVDHCHTTEAVRGILCSHCNFLLGYAKDNTSILESAISYLQEHN